MCKWQVPLGNCENGCDLELSHIGMPLGFLAICSYVGIMENKMANGNYYIIVGLYRGNIEDI